MRISLIRLKASETLATVLRLLCVGLLELNHVSLNKNDKHLAEFKMGPWLIFSGMSSPLELEMFAEPSREMLGKL